MADGHALLNMALKAVVAGALVLCSVDLPAQNVVNDVLALGPIESVNANGLDFSVLGREFHAQSTVAFVVGDYVAVHGSLETDGSTADVWVEYLGAYVPGSDAVYEKGVITEVRPFLGQFSISDSSLDYTPAMAGSASVDPSIGSVMTVSGLQPSSNGTILVDHLLASADAVRDSLMKGGGVQGSLMKGGGVESSLMKGGGVQGSLMKGGGVESSLMKGGGVRSSLIKGGGVI